MIPTKVTSIESLTTNCCFKCIHSIPGCNDKAVGCSMLNEISQYTGNKKLYPHEVRRGHVYEGWFGKGTGHLINGIVVDKDAICYLFEADEKKIIDEFTERRNEKIKEVINTFQDVIEE